MKRILFVGGGSVGHIAPSIAVLEALKEKNEWDSLFVIGNRPEEKSFLEKQSLKYEVLNAPRLSPLFLIRIFSAIQKAKQILKTFRPDIIFSKGGYVSVPLCYAAHTLKIPIVLHESDAVSGYANRLIQRWAIIICKGFPSEKKSSDSRLHITGNPVRKEMLAGSREKGLQLTGFSGQKPVLLIIGGSQGALAINELIKKHLDELLGIADIIHITGVGKEISEKRVGYFSIPFAGTELADLYALTTVAVSRAGAGAIAELAACTVPTIFIPLEHVAHDHQTVNAKKLHDAHAGIFLPQNECERKLVPMIQELLHDEKKRDELRKNLQGFCHPDAARQIASLLALSLDSESQHL